MKNLTNSQNQSSLNNRLFIVTVIDPDDHTLTGKRVLQTPINTNQSFGDVKAQIIETLLLEEDCEIMDFSGWEINKGIAKQIIPTEREFLFQEKYDLIRKINRYKSTQKEVWSN